MLGPANGVSNNLALEKIDCMLILRNIQGGIMGTLGAALATPLFTFILLFLLKKFIHTKYTIYIFFKYSYNQNWRYE